MVLKVLLKFGVWCLLYIINIQGMYLYVYIIVGVCCILDGQHSEIIHVYIILYITSVN